MLCHLSCMGSASVWWSWTERADAAQNCRYFFCKNCFCGLEVWDNCFTWPLSIYVKIVFSLACRLSFMTWRPCVLLNGDAAYVFETWCQCNVRVMWCELWCQHWHQENAHTHNKHSSGDTHHCFELLLCEGNYFQDSRVVPDVFSFQYKHIRAGWNKWASRAKLSLSLKEKVRFK